MIERAYEVNFDGLPGPTHNYGGLAPGNLASQASRARVSHPREAARQSLAKMRRLHARGIRQALLPPHPRPDLALLRGVGLDLADAAVEAPELLLAAFSSSAMWTANAATVIPSADAADGRVHFVPANLAFNLHRSRETAFTARALRRIFPEGARFAHHAPLPGHPRFRDEGAANHTRFCGTLDAYGEPGVHLFVHGARENDPAARFPARQSPDASRAVARLAGLDPQACVFATQHPAAIDAGVFHNDVISTGNRNVFLCHEQAFVDTPTVLAELGEKFRTRCPGTPFFIRVVREDEVSLDEAVRTYLFNCQIVDLPKDEGMVLLAPIECAESPSVTRLLETLVADLACPIREVIPIDLRQSMRNGGGPACLRLRVVLTEAELNHLAGRVLLHERLFDELGDWIDRHYRERLEPADLVDPSLIGDTARAFRDLEEILALPGLYATSGEHG